MSKRDYQKLINLQTLHLQMFRNFLHTHRKTFFGPYHTIPPTPGSNKQPGGLELRDRALGVGLLDRLELLVELRRQELDARLLDDLASIRYQPRWSSLG